MKNLRKFSEHSEYEETPLERYNVRVCTSPSPIHVHYDKFLFNKIEYLQSTGTQWIDTGVTFTGVNNFTLEMDFSPTRFWDYNALLCIGTGTSYESWIYNGGAIVFRYCGVRVPTGNTAVLTLNTKINLKINFDANTHTLEMYIDDVLKGSVTNNNLISMNTTDSLWLMHRTLYAELKLYHFKLIQDNNCILDLIPVRDNNNVGYMYDKVSKQLFVNSGTGNFVLGPDL